MIATPSGSAGTGHSWAVARRSRLQAAGLSLQAAFNQNVPCAARSTLVRGAASPLIMAAAPPADLRR